MAKQSSEDILTLIKMVPIDALRNFLISSGHLIERDWEELVEKKVNESRENVHQVLLELIKNLTFGSIANFYKFCRFFDFQNQWYDVFLTEKNFFTNKSSLIGSNSRFSLPSSIRQLENFPHRIKVSVKMHHHSFGNHRFHLVVVEFVSRSPLARKMFRYLFYPARRLIISDSTATGLKILEDIIRPRVNVSRLEKLPIRALNISHAANKYKTKKLQVRIDLETSGVLGLHSVTLEGDDILEARRKLLARQEETLQLLNLGPWISVETEFFTLAIKKGVKLHRLDSNALDALSETLLSNF